jgi:hypothetical protein
MGGWGRGRGGGRGWRNRFYATGLTGWQRAAADGSRNNLAGDAPAATREQQLDWLRADLRCLEETAANLRRRVDELNTNPASEVAP